MKREELFRAIGEVDEELLYGAANFSGGHKRRRMLRAALIAACCILLISVIAVAETSPDLRIAMARHEDTGEDEDFLTLVKQYERESGKRVSVEFYDSAAELSDRLSTELLAGSGPDLIAGADIDCASYGERGALADYWTLMERDGEIDSSDFYPGVLESLTDAKGRLYQMPAAVTMYFVIRNEELAAQSGIGTGGDWTLERLLEDCVAYTADPVPGTGAIPWGNYFLTQAMEDELRVSLREMVEESGGASVPAVEYLSDPPWVFGDQAPFGEHWDYDLSQNLYFAMGLSLDSYANPIVMTLIRNSEQKLQSFPRTADQAGEALFRTKYALCINQAGNTDTAWEFMKFLLSDEVQTGSGTSMNIIENPVRISAAEARKNLIRDYTHKQLNNLTTGEGMQDQRLMGSYETPEQFLAQLEDYFAAYDRLRAETTAAVPHNPPLEASAFRVIEAGAYADAAAVCEELSRIVSVYRTETAGDLEQGYTTLYWIAGGAAAVGAAAAVVTVVRKRRKARK